MAWIAAMRQTLVPPPKPDMTSSDPIDLVAKTKNGLRLTTALALRSVAALDQVATDAMRRLWKRTTLPTSTDVQTLRASITDLTRAVRDLDRA